MKAHCITSVFAACLLLSSLFALQACKETIDDSNYAIKTEQTAMDFISASPEFSDMKAIYERVRLGDSDDASTLANVLSARGHYTCFLPTNTALREYIREVTGSEDVNGLSYEQAELIAYNSLIDNGEEAAYESPEFPQSGSFSLPALSNRLISCTLQSGTSNYVINQVANVVDADNEVTNGMIHVIDRVLSPSQKTVAEMIMDTPNMQIMGALLKATTWCDSLSADRDLEYDEVEWEETDNLPDVGNFKIADSRYEGYTAFVETDDVMQRWGIPQPEIDEATGEVRNADAIVAAVESKCQSVYGSAALGDYANPENPVNRFVAYHILPTKIAYNRFVHHFNEWNYLYGINALEPSESKYTVNVWDYYTTMGNHRGLMKITQLSDEGNREIYINRASVYENGPNDDYKEISFATGEGLNVKIGQYNESYDNNAKNGFYYPIDAVLLYNETVRQKLGSERIRVDLTTIMTEVITNNVRGKAYQRFPAGYFKNVFNESSDTRIFYLQDGAGRTTKWKDFQGDEFIFAGVFDFILRLPPVPTDQTYELRMGLSNNGNRGMAQIYMGEDPQNLLPLGLPIDLRQGGANNPNIPFVLDGDDEILNLENDKNMRNQGYMKAPKYFLWSDGQTIGTTVRNEGGTVSNVNGGPTLRKILTAVPMAADKTYYLRFKSSLENREAQFFMDYIEIVPAIVYNGSEPEDIW